MARVSVMVLTLAVVSKLSFVIYLIDNPIRTNKLIIQATKSVQPNQCDLCSGRFPLNNRKELIIMAKIGIITIKATLERAAQPPNGDIKVNGNILATTSCPATITTINANIMAAKTAMQTMLIITL